MKKTYLILFACLLSQTVFGGEKVYKKINPDGSVEFTDVPTGNSEEIKVKEPTTYHAPKINLPREKPKASKSALVYSDIRIITPTQDQTYTDNTGNVTVQVSLTPGLNTLSKHRVRYQLGDETRTSTSLSETFANVERGSHQLQVTVVDAEGEAISPVATTTFHVKRYFKKPAPPPPPPPPPANP